MNPKRSRSDYHYFIKNGIMFIVDENRGRMSVTNNIEEVVAEICADDQLSKPAYVIYQDSEKSWDAFDTGNNQFIPLAATDEETALSRFSKFLETKTSPILGAVPLRVDLREERWPSFPPQQPANIR